MATLVPLSRGQVALIDDSDLPLVAKHTWHARPINRREGGFYACTSSGRTTIYMHRLLLGAAKGEQVDHVNGDGLDNRRANIRLATQSLNNANNRRRRNASGFRGVYQERRPGGTLYFRAQVGGKRNFYRGPCRPTAEAAARDYDAHARLRFGEFATLNFPEQVMP